MLYKSDFFSFNLLVLFEFLIVFLCVVERSNFIVCIQKQVNLNCNIVVQKNLQVTCAIILSPFSSGDYSIIVFFGATPSIPIRGNYFFKSFLVCNPPPPTPHPPITKDRHAFLVVHHKPVCLVQAYDVPYLLMMYVLYIRTNIINSKQ